MYALNKYRYRYSHNCRYGYKNTATTKRINNKKTTTITTTAAHSFYRLCLQLNENFCYFFYFSFCFFFCGAFELKYFLCKYFHSSKGKGGGKRDWSVPSWVMALDVCQAASLSLSPSPSFLPSLSLFSTATPACLIIVWQLEVPLLVAAALLCLLLFYALHSMPVTNFKWTWRRRWRRSRTRESRSNNNNEH